MDPPAGVEFRAATRGAPLAQLVEVLGYVNLAAYLALAAVALRQWRLHRGRPALWAALAFLALGLVVVVGRLPLVGAADAVAGRLAVLALLVFPYFLYRFASAFEPGRRRLERPLTAITLALVAATVALPSFPEDGEQRPGWLLAYTVVFLVHWAVLAALAATGLWLGGRGQPTVARRRMRLLAAASIALTLAIVAVAVGGSDAVAAASRLLGLAGAVGFLLGLSPPRLLRVAWREPEQRRVREVVEDLVMLARSEEEVTARVLAPMARLVGARGVALVAGDGRVLGTYGVESPAVEAAPTLEIAVRDVTLLVWTTPYAPVFGAEELALLHSLVALTGLALDRVRLFVQETEARAALERANERQRDFVALAAHELRTPVTTLYGFVLTLQRLGPTLAEERRAEIRAELVTQTERLAELVEQLLDLSRLDADAVPIAPRDVRLRDRLADIVESTAGAAPEVAVEAPPDLVARVDPNALERVVSNLLTNALRYGSAPFRVEAERDGDHVVVAVQDGGRGVPAEFVPELFERFTRSDGSRAVRGTGLGLAIARAYALAHGGELRYVPAKPHGARFELVLPV